MLLTHFNWGRYGFYEYILFVGISHTNKHLAHDYLVIHTNTIQGIEQKCYKNK